VELKPDHAIAHFNLGSVLVHIGRFDGAVEAFRRAVELNPDLAGAHYNLGTTLLELGRLDEAVAALQKARALLPDFAEIHCNLGLALLRQGDFAQALTALKRGHAFGSRRADWTYPSAQWVTECERFSELDRRLSAVLQGKIQVTDADEQNAFAAICYYKKRYVVSVRMRASAFRADAKLADDLKAGYRYDAACAASLAAAGSDADAGQLDDMERVGMRKQCLEWLRADLTAYAKLLECGKTEDRTLVINRLRHWKRDPQLTYVREATDIADLSGEEQQACKQLWSEVEALLHSAATAE
jgi:tetratricopeptide (TPR) repeat protein